LDKPVFHINIYDLAFLGILFVGLTVACLLWFTKRINRRANGFLGAALLVAVSWIATALLNDSGLNARIHASLAFGPFIYFYVLKITRPEFQFSKKNLLHFIPVCTELAFPQIYPLAFFSVLFYIYSSDRLIEAFYQQLQFNEVNDRYRSQLRWLKSLLKGFAFLWFLWVPYSIINYFQPLPVSAAYPIYIILSISFIRIALICFFKEDIKVPVPMPSISRPAIPAELKLKAAWLKQLMETNLYYRDETLTLPSLAQMLELHPNELSRIINSGLEKNFSDFINEYRVQEVVRKMQDPINDKLTLIGIAMDAGFNSKSTFNRVFKEMTGRSPADYKFQRPNYILRPHRKPTPLLSESIKFRNKMYRTYFKTAWRNITANKLFTTLNISGLSIGICICITLFACAAYELSFDKSYKQSANIYRVNMQAGAEFDYKVWAQLPGLGGPTIAQNVSQVKLMTRLLKYNFGGPVSIRTDEKVFKEKGLYMADTAILQFFDFNFIEGNARTAMAQVKDIMISESAKERLYGKQSAIGKVIYADNRDTFRVSAVYKDLPENSTIDCDMIYNIMDS
jgi:AraC-like DNA-binding protein